MDEAENLAKGGGIDGDQGKEIREPYDSDEERQWKEKHKENIKKYNINKQTADVTEDDKELWQRLDELEVQEELDEYLEKEAKEDDGNISIDEDEISDAGSKDWSESPDLSDDEEEEEEAEEQTSNRNNEYQSLSSDANTTKEIKPEHNNLLEKRAHGTDKNSRENQEHTSTEYSSKLSPNAKLVGQMAVQQRTRRVSFGSISEYEYQRDDEYKTNKHEEVLTRHSWSENATTSGNNMPEQDTSATQGKSISMAALAESLAQINAGKILSFAQNTTKTSPSTSEPQNLVISQPEVKISDTPQELDKSESESPQKTPTLFFTHFEEEEDELTSKNVGRNEENRSFPTHSDSTVSESCDHDFVYDSVPKNPADILRLYGFRRCSIDRPRLKGILKPSGSSHSLAEDSSLADDASVSDTSLAKSPAFSPMPSSGRFKISPTKIPEHVVNTLLSSSPINSTSSLRSSPGGSRFSVSPTKISDPSIFTPPVKPCVQTHHLSVDSGLKPSRFSIKPIDDKTFVPPPISLEKSTGVAKEKENVPVNAIVQEKCIPNASSCVTETTEQVPKLVETPIEDADTCKNVHSAGQDNPRKESRFKASRGLNRAKEDKA